MTVPAKTKSTRRVYSAEELQRLRAAPSQPNLQEAIEEHDGEDAELVKEHVLRSSKSFAARSFRSRTSASNSLRVPTQKSASENYYASVPDPNTRPNNEAAPVSGRILGEIAPNGQVIPSSMFRSGAYNLGPSPTPSLKKKKAEALVKAHGSPTHTRVTAGGRIVPSDQSPLCHPRYGYSAIKTNGGLVKFVGNHDAGRPQVWTQCTQEGFIAQDQAGNLCQIVQGRVLPLYSVNGVPQLHIPAPNVNMVQAAPGVSTELFPAGISHVSQSLALRDRAMQPAPGIAATNPQVISVNTPQSLPVGAQIKALELEYSQKERELSDLNKSDVLHGRSMTRAEKDNLVSNRIRLTTELGKIHKAKKALKSGPPADAPTSPHAMQASYHPQQPQQSVSSPGRPRLSTFLQMPQANNGMIVQPSGHAPVASGSGPQVRVQYSPDDMYAVNPWAIPPSQVYAPPPFDGSMASPYPAFVPAPPVCSRIAQTDGAGSLAGPKTNVPRPVPIKAPEPKAASNLKTNLNPMSPVYKPSVTTNARNSSSSQSVDRKILTALSDLPKSQSSTHGDAKASTKVANSPAKQNANMHSSSISSFETADFFPRNTREYSTRPHAYSRELEHSDTSEETLGSPGQIPTASSKAPNSSSEPTAPPGTPASPDVNSALTLMPSPTEAAPTQQQRGEIAMLNRDAHNVSPKAKREWLFVQKEPNETASSSVKSHSRQSQQSTPASTIDFSHKSREWLQGFQAGLQGRAIGGESVSEYLDGYCAGLLKRTPIVAAPVALTRSPKKPQTRRPSLSLPTRPNSRVQVARPPFESNTHSLDTLKQAVYAPQNENTILTPAADGPHISNAPQSLGAWAKNAQTTLTFRKRDSVQGAKSENSSILTRNTNVPLQKLMSISPTTSTRDIASSSCSNSAPDVGQRITSLASIDSSILRQMPASIMTPSEWKSQSSVSHAAGFATGYFAHSQIDGSSDPTSTSRSLGLPLTRSVTGAPQRIGSITSEHTTSRMSPPGSRFREGSLDRITNPPLSPRLTPEDGRDSSKKKDGSSPHKKTSPAKAKFEHMAEKMGIKTGSEKQEAGGDATFDPGSSSSKRRHWRGL